MIEKSKAWDNQGAIVLRSPFMLFHMCIGFSLHMLNTYGTYGFAKILQWNEETTRGDK
jgi:hypothetical protein